jgi:two-component system, OmpR family, response regulator
MLVLSRHRDEKIVLPSLGVTIQVLDIRRGVVRLGIAAPPEVIVLRQEVVGKPRRNAGPGEPEPRAR